MLDAQTLHRLFFAGDLGQRIFEPPFSWKSLGIDIRGRSTTLRVNYRTSHQIRATADRLLAPKLTDVDGNTEARKGTVSVFNGPQPEIHIFPAADTVELEEVYQTERHLLYVAATRARDSLVLTAVTPGSEFLQDLQA